jgi:hypothetical protein
MAGPNRKPKAPKYPLGQPGSPGTRYAPSSRKQPNPTGMDPSNPGYGTMTSGGQKDPASRGNSLFGSGNRNLRDGQSDLQSKAPRQFCQD